MNKAFEIAENIIWVGVQEEGSILQCNPYIIRGAVNVLIDPGSVLEQEDLLANVRAIVPLEEIHYVVLTHQDPDICAAMPYFEANGLRNAKVLCHWRTGVIVRHYGFNSPIISIQDLGMKLKLTKEQELVFMETPYLHFPGAIAVYETSHKVLFSSDLFGAIGKREQLYAQSEYLESMLAFHENYMPSNDIIRPVMERFLLMDIKLIAPQHGCLINRNVKAHIEALRDLECGSFLNPIKKELGETGGYLGICNSIIKRMLSLFNSDEVFTVFADSDIIIDKESGKIDDFNSSGEVLWNSLFDLVLAKKGMAWISVLEVMVRNISTQYGIDSPKVYQSSIYNMQTQLDEVNSKNKELEQLTNALMKNLEDTTQQLTHCSLTNFYNLVFFNSFIKNEVLQANESEKNFAFLFIEIDDFSSLSFDLNANEQDEIIRSLAYLLNEFKKAPSHNIFKLNGPVFAYHIPEDNGFHPEQIAEEFRQMVYQSEAFAKKITVSIAIASLNELELYLLDPHDVSNRMIRILENRLVIAKQKGKNIVCSESNVELFEDKLGKLLIVDTDELNIDVLKTNFEARNYEVLISNDGKEALELVESQRPNLVIAEQMIPKMDAFSLRSAMLRNSMLKEIPMILISNRKDDSHIVRAYGLEIAHYLKKPFYLSEITSIVDSILRN